MKTAMLASALTTLVLGASAFAAEPALEGHKAPDAKPVVESAKPIEHKKAIEAKHDAVKKSDKKEEKAKQ